MFQSAWGQPAQNQQTNQPTTGAFGQTNAFGSPSGGSVFGQPAQTTTGAFGNPLNTNAGASSSAFGAQPTQNAFSSSTFGANVKPAAGFGTFGSTTASPFGGGGGAFGASNPTGGTMFGQNAQPATNNVFGASTSANSVFGAPKPSAFGTTDAPAQPVTTGSSNPPYAVFSEKDAASNSSTLLNYQSISAMPAYRGTSAEELRVQDYQQGRKTATNGGGFGQSTFGGAQPTTNTFGAAPAAQSSSIFGANTFGSTNTGQTGTNTFGGGTGAFGQTNSQPASTGFGFGSTQPATGNTFGGFGAPSTTAAAPASSIFGANTNNNTTTPSSIFGQKPATNVFGSGNTFGQGASTTFGTTPTNTFGQPAAAAPGTTNAFGSTGAFGGGSTFGANNNAPKPSIFGSNPAGTTPSNPFATNTQAGQSGSIFGSNTGSTGIFGQNNQNPTTQTSIFGANNNAAPAPATNNLFGGGFGTNNNQQQTGQAAPATGSIFGNAFGAKPPSNTTTGGIFGGGNLFGGNNTSNPATQPSSNLFSGLNNSQNNATGTTGFGSSLFNKPAAPVTGGTGTLFGNQPGIFGSSLNAMNSSQPAQGTLTASVSQPINTNLPIFSLLPQGPRPAIETPKKKPTFFVDVPTRSPVPKLQLGYTPASSKLRGFGDSLTSSTNAHALSLSRSGTPDLFNSSTNSLSLGSGSRSSVKKLVLDKTSKADSDMFSRTPSLQRKASGAVLNFSPSLGQALRENEATTATANGDSRRGTDSLESSIIKPISNTPAVNAFSASAASETNGDLQEGDYWVKPDLSTLTNKGHEELVSCSGLIVGRVGFGEIHFLEPVDLTGLSRLGTLKGAVIKFADQTCSVYPDTDDADKPRPGSGLNVKARIILLRCWTFDKATREPIKDENNKAAAKHLKKLKAVRGTHFESFDYKEGKWTFTVDHF